MISIKLHIRPMPSPRPRVHKFGAYMPKSYTEHKKLIQDKLHGFKMFPRVPLEIDAVFAIKPSKTYRRNKYPTPKGDIDNMLKSVLDAMNGILFEDDVLISKATATKQYADHDYIHITLKEITV